MNRYLVYKEPSQVPWPIYADYFAPGNTGYAGTGDNDGILRFYKRGSPDILIASFALLEWTHVERVERVEEDADV